VTTANSAGHDNVKALSMTFIMALTSWSDVIIWMQPIRSVAADALSLRRTSVVEA